MRRPYQLLLKSYPAPIHAERGFSIRADEGLRFGHFSVRMLFCYRAELAKKRDLLDQLRALRRRGPVTLVFAAKDEQHSSAAVLKDVLESD